MLLNHRACLAASKAMLTPLAIAALSIPVFAQSVTVSGNVAEVNGKPISSDALVKALMTYPSTGQDIYPVPIGRQAATVVLEKLIQNQLTLQLAESEGVTPTKEQLDERRKEMILAASDTGQDIEGGLKEAGLTAADMDDWIRPGVAELNVLGKYIKVGDEELRAEYRKATTDLPDTQRFKSPFYIPSKARVYIIINPDKDKIDAALEELNSGADFAAVARKYSIDQFTSARGGEVGWVEQPDEIRKPTLDVPKAFYDQAFKVVVGKPSPAFQANSDWVIIRVSERKRAWIQPFEHVKTDIKERMLRQKMSSTPDLVKLLEDFRKKASVKVLLPVYAEAFSRLYPVPKATAAEPAVTKP